MSDLAQSYTDALHVRKNEPHAASEGVTSTASKNDKLMSADW
jgi:hypothetical protein